MSQPLSKPLPSIAPPKTFPRPGAVGAAASANQMAGEKCVSSGISFPLTGDYEGDLICGCLAVLESLGTYRLGTTQSDQCRLIANVFSYLARRYAIHFEQWKAVEKDRERIAREGIPDPLLYPNVAGSAAASIAPDWLNHPVCPSAGNSSAAMSAELAKALQTIADWKGPK